MPEDRHDQIRERAGLEESRLNEGFIEFLQKYSTSMLLAILVVVGVYAAYNKYSESKDREVSAAFEEYQAGLAGGTGNPVVLIELAEKFKNVRSVGLLARLSAADAYLAAVRQGNALGAALNPDGTLQSNNDVLTTELRDRYLAAAKEQYQLVFDAASSNKEKIMLALPAGFGLASVAESMGNKSDAKTMYEKIASIAEQAQDAVHADIARKRAASLDTLDTMVLVMDRKDVPKKPEPKPDIVPNAPAAPLGPINPLPVAPGTPSPASAPPTDPNAIPQPATPPTTPPAEPAPK